MNKFSASTEDKFESSFFQLAYDQLQDKLSNLLPFLVGFEVVKKADNGTKAIGVFGFQSHGGQVIYVPAFFINGKIKGLDLLYSKNNESFYPLNEDFAELFLKDSVTDVGTPTKLPKDQVAKDLPPADFRNLVAPPRTGKMSVAEFFDEDKVTQPTKHSLLDYVKEGSPKVKSAFWQLMKNADFCESVLRFYDMEKVAEAMVIPNQKIEEAKELDVIRKGDGVKSKGMTEQQKKDLQIKGYYIRDSRKKEKYAKFGAFEYNNKFQNPVKTGFYPYVTRAGGIRYGLILVRPWQLQQHFATDDDIVVDLDSGDKGNAYIAPATNVYAKDEIVVPDFSDVHKMMVNPPEEKPSFSDTFVLINESLQATQVFRIVSSFKDADDVRRLAVEPVSHAAKLPYSGAANPRSVYDQGAVDRPGSAHSLPRGNFYEHPKKERQIMLVFTKRKGFKLEYNGNAVYVPAGFKLLKLNLVADEDHADAKDRSNGPACHLNVFSGTMAAKNIFPLTLQANGSSYFARLSDARKSYDSPIDAKIGMVMDFGLGVKEAEELIDSLPQGKPVKGYIKFAYTGDASPYPIYEVPYTNELGQDTYTGIGQENMLPAEQTQYRDPTQLGLGNMPNIEGIDPEEVSHAVQLASAGQKQIFDTHTIGVLAKYVAPSEKVQEYMPDFVKTIDSLGRLLFLVHWEVDKFKEMYGRSDMPKLVELLTNVFRNLGDLVIFLKRKSPEVSINSTDSDVLDV